MIEAVIAGLFGLLIGSFLNVCIFRLPRDLSVVQPRSFCPACEHQIRWYDNVPLLSYILLRGRCRDCGEKISIRYPLVELTTGLLFFGVVAALGVTWVAAKFCVFGTILLVLIVSDLEERILPDEFTKGGAILGVLFAAVVPLNGIWRFLLPSIRDVRIQSIIESVFAAVFSSLALWLVGAVYQKIRHREGLGFGDIKMVAMIGAFLGLQGALLTLIVGSLLGSVIGIVYVLITRKDLSTYELPFGSFLGAAAFGVALYGEFVVAWWSRLGT